MQIPQVVPFTQVPQAIQDFLLTGGISDKGLLEFSSAIIVSSSWITMRTESFPKLLSKTRLVFFLSDKMKMTIRKTGQSSKNTTMTRHITWQEWALSSLHLQMIWIIEYCCVEVKACGQNARLELCCHHSGWGIVLQADAAEMGKCCYPRIWDEHFHVFQWSFPDFVQYNYMKYLHWGTIYLNKILQTSHEI